MSADASEDSARPTLIYLTAQPHPYLSVFRLMHLIEQLACVIQSGDTDRAAARDESSKIRAHTRRQTSTQHARWPATRMHTTAHTHKHTRNGTTTQNAVCGRLHITHHAADAAARLQITHHAAREHAQLGESARHGARAARRWLQRQHAAPEHASRAHVVGFPSMAAAPARTACMLV